MRSPSGANVSVWLATSSLIDLPPLSSDEHADVCVVGAGLSGMTIAYLTALEGRSVVLIDDGAVAGGETHHTTAHLVTALDDRYYELERLHGERGARLAASSHGTAIDTIEEIVGRENIDCDFERVDGFLFVPPGDSTDILSRECRAAERAGVKVDFLEHLPLDFYEFGPALRFESQAQFHAVRYMNGLAAAVKRVGGRMYGAAHATSIEGGAHPSVRTASGYTIEADAIAVATNTPVNDRVAMHTKQAPYRTYVIAARVAAGSVPHVLLWDTPDPYHYVRVQRGKAEGRATHDYLIVGGEDHKTGQADDFEQRFAALEAWTRARFPMVEDVPLRWSGQVMEPIDGLAFIGRDPGEENVYITTGDSGNGMTHGTIAGLLISDLIAGRDNPWATLYDPSRKCLRAVSEYMRENANVIAQYADHVTAADVGSTESIRAGDGAVIRRGVKQLAVYRDEHGALHTHSAICTHLGCVVHWNGTEKTWDCPCHGSRYDKLDGHVLNGPAIKGLTPVK